jgi:hypothetical protein
MGCQKIYPKNDRSAEQWQRPLGWVVVQNIH